MNLNWQTFLKTRRLIPAPEEYPQEKTDRLLAEPWVSQLASYSILDVQGEDAAGFLQGQTTCDVQGLQQDRASPGAFCNPKGRVMSTFWLFGQTGGFRLVVPEALAAALEKRLRMYVLRSRVKIENLTDSLAIFGFCCDALPSSVGMSEGAANDPRYPLIRLEDSQIVKIGPRQWLFIGAPEAAEQRWREFVQLDGFAETGEEFWNLLCVLNGIPRITRETGELFVPQMVNLDALGGISFKKGCYTGQEIVARMHYLGKLKRRMFLAATRTERLPAPGDPVYLPGNEQAIGQIVEAAFLHHAEVRLLAVLQTEHIRSASVRLEDSLASSLKILELPYTFGVPEP